MIADAGYADSFARKDLKAAMERLFEGGILQANAELWRGPSRHWIRGIRRAPCAEVPDHA